ncbi:hypothetical protein DQ04_13291000 [Trypanosoma grayi]|uniref:hypothetical protein n=1 Tax=Trypanosoma grayi TaxID=71804 RepID=UPI0004F4B68E|nr:hypothetical protein DQ04_13291000 [Trypanosoma grayi]KEG06572.1 hypothetical protein DQ04_13291000 [Trypanosoma grayi]
MVLVRLHREEKALHHLPHTHTAVLLRGGIVQQLQEDMVAWQLVKESVKYRADAAAQLVVVQLPQHRLTPRHLHDGIHAAGVVRRARAPV